MLDIEAERKKQLVPYSNLLPGKKMGEKSFERKDLCVYLYPEAISHNIQQLKNCCKENVKFCAVVKANAYGHGILEVVHFLRDSDIDFFAVASIYEAFHIAALVQRQQILVLEPLYPGLPEDDIKQCAEFDFHCTLSSLKAAKYVNSILKKSPAKLKVHVNIDTGMGRCGIAVEDAEKLVKYICSSKSMVLAGIYTHFANADEKDLTFAKEQVRCFKTLISKLRQYITDSVIIHAANSPATIRMPEAHFDMVRCGISIYGYSTIEKPLPVDLKPALKLQAPIVHITTIAKGRTVSYGRKFTAHRKTKIAVLPVGYSGGFWRFFSNRSKVRINESIVDVIGVVTMNQIVIDVTDVPDVQLGQPVTIIDNQLESPCGVYSLALLSGTICYEILTSIPTWVKVVVSGNNL